MTTQDAHTIAAEPLAGRELVPAYHEIAAMLAGLGVEEVFGLMGDDTVRLVSALADRGVRYTVRRPRSGRAARRAAPYLLGRRGHRHAHA